MTDKILFRQANINDLSAIISLLLEDDLGNIRETTAQQHNAKYSQAFNKIMQDPNQYLTVTTKDNKIIGTLHLTIIPPLTFIGSIRAQIEAVRVDKKYRNQKIGQFMIEQAIKHAKTHDASIL